MPDIKLRVNGKIYGGWKQASVTRSINAIAGSFNLSVMDRWEAGAQPWQIFPGDACVLEIDGKALITGYVDAASPSYGPDAHGIEISGRDKTCDLVDCSADVKAYELRSVKLEEIVSSLARPFGLKVVTQADTGAKFESFAIQPGETCFEAIERAARQRFMAVTTNGAGDVVIADIGTQRAADMLVEGRNIKEARAGYDYTDRFSEYIVKGQAAAREDGEEPSRNAVESTASDPAITRYRPKILAAEMQASDGSAENRAQLEASTRAGKSTKIGVTVQGWTMSNGELWPLNALVTLQSPMLLADDVELLITQVEFSISDSAGMVADLELMKPGTYLLGRNKGKKKKKKGESKSPIDWELEGYD
ncbi:Mu-like prophage tail protein gpP [Bordetella phage PY223]